MAATEKSPFSAEHIAEFNRIQALRPVLFRRLTDKLEIFRLCPNKTCRRMRACQDAHGACFLAVLDAMPDEIRRSLAYAVRNRANGLEPDEAIAQAQARVAGEMARDGE